MTDDRQQPSEDALRAELRRAAADHDPDRTAMLNRIAANRGARRTARGRTASLAGAALAVVAVLGVGGIASALTIQSASDTRPAAPPSVTTASAGPSPSASPSSRPAASRSHSPTPSSAPPSPSVSAVRGHPGDTQVDKGSLSSDGSITVVGTGVAESVVTVKAEADLSALDLTIRVVLTPGLADQGGTDDVTSGEITVTVEHQAGALIYHFVLREGVTLPAGTYHFTGRYGYQGASRDAGDDTYEAYASDAEHKRPHIYGNFY